MGVDYDIVDVDLAQRAHKSSEFLALNALGQVPVLEDDGVVIADSNAILVYLAKKYGRTDWLPEDAAMPPPRCSAGFPSRPARLPMGRRRRD